MTPPTPTPAQPHHNGDGCPFVSHATWRQRCLDDADRWESMGAKTLARLLRSNAAMTEQECPICNPKFSREP